MPKQPRVASYVIDLQAGNHAYAFVEGVGECRENFRQLVAGMECGTIDLVLVMKAQFLFIETSPMWMEKLIAAAKRHHITIVDASTKEEFDLAIPSREAAFRAYRKAP